MDENDVMQQLRDEYQRVMQRVYRYFWLFFLIGAMGGVYLAITTEPPPFPKVPPLFWLMII